MGSNERLKKLEAALPPERSRAESDEARHRREWLVDARLRRHRNQDNDERLALDLIRLLRRQGRMPEDADGLRARLLAWRPPLDPSAVERAVARAVYDQEEGTENMVCPPEWRESFEAAAELRERYAAVPAATHARLILEAAASDAEECEEAEALGLTGELHLRAAGPDVEDISDAELHRRLRLILYEDYFGDRGYLVAQHIRQLQKEEQQ